MPLVALTRYKVPAYPADALPPELAAIPAVKPGSRGLAMIIGLGNDLSEISRVADVLEKYGERFTHRCFTEIERRSPTAAPSAPPPTPSASPPRRPAPRRSAPA